MEKDKRNGVYEGRDPQKIYEEAVASRPIPAIEKPLGSRAMETQPAETTVYEVSGALLDWNNVARKHPWG